MCIGCASGVHRDDTGLVRAMHAGPTRMNPARAQGGLVASVPPEQAQVGYRFAKASIGSRQSMSLSSITGDSGVRPSGAPDAAVMVTSSETAPVGTVIRTSSASIAPPSGPTVNSRGPLDRQASTAKSSHISAPAHTQRASDPGADPRLTSSQRTNRRRREKSHSSSQGGRDLRRPQPARPAPPTSSRQAGGHRPRHRLSAPSAYIGVPRAKTSDRSCGCGWRTTCGGWSWWGRASSV